MLSVQNEIINEILAGISPLVDLYMVKSPEFTERVILWLKDSEYKLSKTRLPEGSRLASMRSRILSAAEKGENEQGDYSPRKAKRLRNFEASGCLEEVEQVLSEVRVSNINRLEMFKAKLEEAITAASLLGLIPETEKTTESELKFIWKAMMENQSTKPTAIYISSSLSSIDRLFILKELVINLKGTILEGQGLG